MSDPSNAGPFGNTDPFATIPDALKPNPPPSIPEPLEAGNAAPVAHPFTEPQSFQAIIDQLILDRPLKLFIPNKEKFPQYEFRIINSIPNEVADAHNKGFREVTDPELSKLFIDLVAGTDKTGKAYRPLLVARPKAVGEHIRRRNRLQLQSLYAGMDPANKDLAGKYTENVPSSAGTKGSFSGPAFRIRV